MISNFTKKSLLVRTIILLCAPFLFFSDADAARRRSVSGPTRVQRAAAIVTAPVGKTEPSPAAAAQIAELKAQMARNAAEEVKEDAAEAEEDRLEAIEDEEERREDASAAKEEAAREKRAEEYRKLIESYQKGEEPTVRPGLMEPLNEEQFEPKPVAEEWVPAETPPADFSLDDTTEAVAEDTSFDLGGEPAMPADDFGAMPEDDFGAIPAEDSFGADDFGADAFGAMPEEPDMMLEPEVEGAEPEMEIDLPFAGDETLPGEEFAAEDMAEPIPGADIVGVDGAPPKRADLKLVLKLLKVPVLGRITSLQLAAYREILEGKSNPDPEKNYAPAIYEETPVELVQDFVKVLKKFYDKNLDKAKVKADVKTEFELILGLALRTPKIKEVDTDKKLQRLKGILEAKFNLAALLKQAEKEKDFEAAITIYRRIAVPKTGFNKDNKDTTQKEDEDVIDYIKALTKFKEKIDDKADKLKADTRKRVLAKLPVLLNAALKNPRVKAADTAGFKPSRLSLKKQVDALQDLADSIRSGFNFNAEFRVAMKSKELIGPDSRISKLMEITSRVINQGIPLTEKQLEYLIKGIVITRKKVVKASWKDETKWRKIQGAYIALVKKAYNGGVGPIADFDLNMKKTGKWGRLLVVITVNGVKIKKAPLSSLAEELKDGLHFNAWYRKAIKKTALGWKKKFDWRIPIFREMIKRISSNHSDKQVKAFVKALGYFRSKMSDMTPAQKALYKTAVYSALENPIIEAMDKKQKEKLAQAKKVFVTGFDFVSELKAAMEAKKLTGTDGKIAKFSLLTRKVLQPKNKDQLSALEKGYMIRGIVSLKKKVYKDKAAQGPYTKLVNLAYGDGINILATQDTVGVKYSKLKGKEPFKLKELKATVGTGFYFDMLRKSAVAAETVLERITILYGMVAKIIEPKFKITISEDQAVSLVKTIVKTKAKVDKEDPTTAKGKEVLGKFVAVIKKAHGHPTMAKVDKDGIVYIKLTTKKKGRLKDMVAELKTGFNFDAYMNKVDDVSGSTLEEFNKRVPLFYYMVNKITDKHTAEQREDFLKAVTLKAFRTGYAILKGSTNKSKYTEYTDVLRTIKTKPFLYGLKPKTYRKRIDKAYPIFSTGFDFAGELEIASKIGSGSTSKRVSTLNALNKMLIKITADHDKDTRKKYVELVRDLYLKAKKKKHAAIKSSLSTFVKKVRAKSVFSEFMSKKLGSTKPKKFSDILNDFATW